MRTLTVDQLDELAVYDANAAAFICALFRCESDDLDYDAMRIVEVGPTHIRVEATGASEATVARIVAEVSRSTPRWLRVDVVAGPTKQRRGGLEFL